MSIPAEAAAIRAHPGYRELLGTSPAPDGEVQAVLVTMFAQAAAEVAQKRSEQDTAATPAA